MNNLNLNDPVTKYFNIELSQKNVVNGVKSTKYISLVPCDRNVWLSIEPTIGETFDKLKFSNWLCTPENTVFNFQGKFSSDIFKYVKISVKKCSAVTGDNRTCATSTFIDDFLSTSGSFTFNYYILENRVYHCQYNDRSKSMMILSPTLEDYLVQLWEHSSL